MLRLIVVKPLLSLLVVVPLLAACGGGVSSVETDEARAAATAPPASPASTPAGVPARIGPLEDRSSAASCVEAYSSLTLRNRDFALDGTVIAIGPAGTNKPDKGHLETAAVTLEVNEWFTGGTEDQATIDLMSPTRMAGDDTPLYEVGTRLLVSGEPRWGGPPLQDAIAWSCGGFTSYYEPRLADEWRAALSGG